MKTYLVYNPQSNNNTGEDILSKLKEIWRYKEFTLVDITSTTYAEILADMSVDDELLVTGGDGTLYHLANGVDGDNLTKRIYFYPSGSGNDFWNDVKEGKPDEPLLINDYLKQLPTVTVKGKTSRFVNGIGYGIDGYCCEEGDRLKEKSDKPINYTSIAIKGLLFHYKPTNATVEVDGKKHHFKKCWLAPTMNGRFYGGGMMPAPEQDRLNTERTVTTMVMSGGGKIKTLIAFPSLFEGKHVEKTKLVSIFTGKHVKVSFDRPVALQIDGETVLNVTEYEVNSAI